MVLGRENIRSKTEKDRRTDELNGGSLMAKRVRVTIRIPSMIHNNRNHSVKSWTAPRPRLRRGRNVFSGNSVKKLDYESDLNFI